MSRAQGTRLVDVEAEADDLLDLLEQAIEAELGGGTDIRGRIENGVATENEEGLDRTLADLFRQIVQSSRNDAGNKAGADSDVAIAERLVDLGDQFVDLRGLLAAANNERAALGLDQVLRHDGDPLIDGFI